MHGNIYDELGSNRVYIWRHALSIVPNRPLLGTGPDAFFFAFPPAAHAKYGEFYDKAHNEYLQILVCQGILGLTAYLAFLGSVIITGTKKAFSSPAAAAALIAATGYLVQAFFNISHPIASQILWVMFGLLTCRHIHTERKQEEQIKP